MLIKISSIDDFSPIDGGRSIYNLMEDGMDKIASLGSHIPEKLQKRISYIEKNAEKNKAYFYIRALGAGEVYGPNNNGDWFGKDELINHHETFEKDAHFFRNHNNKDPRNKIGDVSSAAYNYELDTVDLIAEADTKDIQEELAKIASGDSYMMTSMGAKVPYDECSICGNKAKQRIQYCNDLRFNMLKILPDGRQVHAKNPSPKFVDISSVIVPAEPYSKALRKIASYFDKESEIKKTDIGNIQDRGVIKKEVIDAVSHLPFSEGIGTLTSTYGPLRPDEFLAVLHKDASLIQESYIPYVSYEQPTKTASFVSNETLGKHLDFIETNNCGSDFVHFSMTPMEKMAYINYRHSINFSRVFFR